MTEKRYTQEDEDAWRGRFERVTQDLERAKAATKELEDLRNSAGARLDDMAGELNKIPVKDLPKWSSERRTLLDLLDVCNLRMPRLREQHKDAEKDWKDSKIKYGQIVAERWSDQIRDLSWELAITPSGNKAERLKLRTQIEAAKASARLGI